MSRHRSRKPTLAPVVVLILGGAVLSCGPGVDEHTVRLGVILPLTGPSASLGESAKRGAELAVAEVNAGGRLGERHLEIVYGDSRGQAEGSVEEYRRIWQEERVPAIIAAQGEVVSALPGLIADQPAGELPVLLSLDANAAGTESSELAFRCAPTAYQEAEAMARFALEDLGMLRVSIYVQNDDHGRDGGQAFEREFVRLGGRIATGETFEEDAEEHDPSTLWKLERAAAQGIYVVGDSDAYGTAFRQIRDREDIHGELLTGSEFSDAGYRELAGEAAEGVLATTTLFESQLRYEIPAARDFIDRFREAHGEEPDSPAAFAYSAVTLLARAIEGAAAATPVEIRRVLADPDRIYDLPIGKVTFNENRDAELRLVVQRFTEGSFVPAKRVLAIDPTQEPAE